MADEMFPGTTAISLSRRCFSECKQETLRERAHIVGIELKPSFASASSSSAFSGTSTSAQPSVSRTSASLSASVTSVSDLTLELQQEREKREALELEVSVLRKRLAEKATAESSVDYKQKLSSEISDPVLSRNILLHGPDTVEHFDDFSMTAVIATLKATCPEVYSLVQQLGSTQRYARDGVLPDEELKGVMAICTLLNARSSWVKGLQLMISLMLVARASGRQVMWFTLHIQTYTWMLILTQTMTLLNHAGVCMSYTATWDHLLAFTQEANLLTKVQTGNWIWAYDNLNIHRVHRHERQGTTSTTTTQSPHSY